MDADFWWLSDAEPDALLLGVAHTEPLRDADDLGQMIRSVDAHGLPSATAVPLALSDLTEWRGRCANENVYRSLRLFDLERRPVKVGPFYLDLDADDGPDGEPDFDAAAIATRQVAELLMRLAVQRVDLKVWMTGHKGFNVEVRPEALAIDGPEAWVQRHDNVLASLHLPPRVGIDRIFSRFPPHALRHKYLRLTSSKNVWLAADGSKRWRIKREVTLEELFNRTGLQIAGEAQSLVI